MEECTFCAIARGEQEGHVVYEDEDTVAFLDINPVAPGHTLVIHRDHHATLTEMPPGNAGAMFETVRTVAAAIETALDPDGINAFHSSGAAAGQDVHHAHVHVIPRHEHDAITFSPPRRNLTEGEGEDVVAKIRQHL